MKYILSFALLVFSTTSHQMLAKDEVDQPFDVLITNARIIDGTGREAFTANIGIRGDEIIAIGNMIGDSALKVIDAKQRVVSPGFIDLHSHDERNVIRRPQAENIIRQGVTTLLTGNCGGSPVDLATYFETLAEAKPALNIGVLIGHNSVRRKIMQRDNRLATEEEMLAMRNLVSQAMVNGAFGMSSGLGYIPGAFAPPEELQVLASEVHKAGGFYASHMRSEGTKLIEAVQETIDVAQATGVPVHISHHKASGPKAWGKSIQTLKMVDDNRAKGLEISLDQYPYTASNTSLAVLLPSWSLAGGYKASIKRLDNPETAEKISKDIAKILRQQRAGEELWRVQVSQYKAKREYEGLNLKEILELRGQEPTVANAVPLIIEFHRNGGGRGIYHTMLDDDVERIMKHPMTSVASDSLSPVWQEGSPHPRNYGTYPRTLAYYVREKQVLTLPEAINKMTLMPAERMGLANRGKIAPGYKADLVIFDPDKVQDNSTFKNPHQYSTGMDYVMVNGVAVISNGEVTGERAGIALKN